MSGERRCPKCGRGWASHARGGSEQDCTGTPVAAEQPAATPDADVRDGYAAVLHGIFEFNYDECDHGTYSGGPNHGQPYAMCERFADALVASPHHHGVLAAKRKAAVAPFLALHVTDDGVWCDHDGFSWPCPTVRAAAQGTTP